MLPLLSTCQLQIGSLTFFFFLGASAQSRSFYHVGETQLRGDINTEHSLKLWDGGGGSCCCDVHVRMPGRLIGRQAKSDTEGRMENRDS